MERNYITFDEGMKANCKSAYSVMIKPVGSMCNLNCTYCYYIDKKRLYGNSQNTMSDDILEAFINDYLYNNSASEIVFMWHGGEPLMAGLDFFEKAIEIQNRSSKKISNCIQTNGILITDEWCNFFHKNNFLVGISIDGPEDIHNFYRKNNYGYNSFEKALRSINLMQKHCVEFNTLSVVNNLSEQRGQEIYQFLKGIGAKYMQFLPCIDYIYKNSLYKDHCVIASPTKITNNSISSGEIIKAPWSVSSGGYGNFLNNIFDDWVISDVGNIFVQLFDMTLCSWCNISPPVCAYRESCGDVLVLEHNGDVYSCDHFVYEDNLLGTINDSKIIDILHSPKQILFGTDKRNTLSRECIRCKYYFACKGECPKHRHSATADGELKFSLCDGIKLYYNHTKPYMLYMRDLLMSKKSPSEVMEFAKTMIMNSK